MKVKNIVLVVVFIATTYIQNVFAQDNASVLLQKTITDYLQVKNALTKDYADSVSVYADTLSSDLRKVPMEELSSEQHKIGMKYYEKLFTHANEIGKAKDLKNQRKHFADLSKEFYQMLKQMKINNADLFYQYCPMADAYWVSEETKITNPYFGKKMLSCGSTKEKIKSNE